MKYRGEKRLGAGKRAATSAAVHRAKKNSKVINEKPGKNLADYDESITLDAIDRLDAKRHDIQLWQKADRNVKELVDSQLLERAQTQWQFGDWESLAAIEKKDIESHPDGALIALFAAAGKAQQGKIEAAGEFMRLSEEWGCYRGRILQIMISGVYNSLGCAAAIAGQKKRAYKHFEESVLISGITGDEKLITKVRESEQFEQLGISRKRLHREEDILFSGHERITDMGLFLDMFEKCRPYLSSEILGDLDAVRDSGLLILDKNKSKKPDKVLAELIVIKDNWIALDPPMRFLEYHDIPILLKEILVDENYRTDINVDNPVIIDGGANFGLAIYYFKKKFPNATIIAFEPNPELVNVLEKNMISQNWNNVEIVPAALTAVKGRALFFVPNNMPMGGSISTRLSHNRKDITEYEINCETLSAYLQNPIHLLKLDIEGKEVEVLEESEPLLCNVDRIFCEFHFGADLAEDRLPRLLSVLSRSRFNYTIANMGISMHSGANDPFRLAATGKSLNIHAIKTGV